MRARVVTFMVGALALAGCPKSSKDQAGGALSSSEKAALAGFAKTEEAVAGARAERQAWFLAEGYGESVGNKCFMSLPSAAPADRAAIAAECKLKVGDGSIEQAIVEHVAAWYVPLRKRLPDGDPLAAELDKVTAAAWITLPVAPGKQMNLPKARNVEEAEGTFYLVVTADAATGGHMPRVRITRSGVEWEGSPADRFPGAPAMIGDMAKAARAEGEARLYGDVAPEPTAKDEDEDDSAGAGSGTKMALEEGKMGKKDSDRASGQYAIKNRTPTLARPRANAPHDGLEAVLVLIDQALPATRLAEVLAQFRDGSAALAVQGTGATAVLNLAFGVYDAATMREEPMILLLLTSQGVVLSNQLGERKLVATPAEAMETYKALRTLPALADADGVLLSVEGDSGKVSVQQLVELLDALYEGGARWVRVAPPGAPFGELTGDGTIHVPGPGGGYEVGGEPDKGGLPKVNIGNASSTGDLDKNIIRRYVRQKLPQIEYCYQKRLLDKPGLAGTITVQFTINGNGAVINAKAAGLDDRDVEECVEDAVKSIQFPKPTGGGFVNVTYPFTFTTGGK